MKKSNKLITTSGLFMGILGMTSVATAAPSTLSDSSKLTPKFNLHRGLTKTAQFEKAIKNKGKLKRGGKFAKLDLNKDGKIQRAEMKAQRTKMVHKMFSKLDANRDGVLTNAELGKKLKRNNKLKKAGDSKKAIRKQKRSKRKGRTAMINKRIKRADLNKDGKLTLNELLVSTDKRFNKRFARMDKNSDGVLTKAELKARAHGKKGERKAWKKNKKGRRADRAAKRAAKRA